MPPSRKKKTSSAAGPLQTAVSSAPLILFAIDKDGLVTVSDGAGLAMIGRQPGELVGISIQELFKDRPDMIENVRRALAGETLTVVNDYEGASLETTLAPIVGPRGEIVGTLGVSMDVTARRKAQDDLERSLSLHRSTIESTADGLLVVDRQGRFTSFNQRFVELWNLPKEAIESGDDAQALEHALRQLKDPDAFMARVKELYSSPDAESFDVLEFEDGRVIERYSRPQRVGGECVGRVWSFRDVTARRRAEEGLRLLQTLTLAIGESRDLDSAFGTALRKICEATGWILGQAWVPGPAGDKMVCSPAWFGASRNLEDFREASCKLSFAPGEGLPGRVWATRRPLWLNCGDEAGGLPRSALGKSAGLHTAVGFPVLARQEVVAVLEFFTASPREDDERLLGVAAAAGAQLGSLILRKKAEADRAQLLVREREARGEAQASEKKAAFLADASAMLESSLDYSVLDKVARLAVPFLADWCFTFLLDPSEAAPRIGVACRDPEKAPLAEAARRLGASVGLPEDPIGRVLRSGKAVLRAEVVEEDLRRAAASEEHRLAMKELDPRSVIVAPLLARERTLGALAFVLTGESGRRYGPSDLALAEELARRSALAVDNARLYRSLEQLHHIKSKLLSIASHDLRAPLQVAMSYTHVLLEKDFGALNPNQEDFLLKILKVLLDQQQLVENLLDMAHFDRKGLTVQLRPLDLKAVFDETAESFLQIAHSCGLKLLCRAEGPAWVNGDDIRLRQLMTNLLQNAMKFTPEGGTVEFGLSCEGGRVALTVKDTGAGIPPGELKHIFKSLYQVPAARTKRPGLGIGLAICREIVEGHGGSIWAESEGIGRGAAFVVQLPAAAVPAPEPSPAALPKGPAAPRA